MFVEATLAGRERVGDGKVGSDKSLYNVATQSLIGKYVNRTQVNYRTVKKGVGDVTDPFFRLTFIILQIGRDDTTNDCRAN